MNIQEIGARLNADLPAYPPGVDEFDLHVMCISEEAGELVGAYRRWSGRARRKGTFEEIESEVADVLIVLGMFADRIGIDLDKAVSVKLEKIYSRGWSE